MEDRAVETLAAFFRLVILGTTVYRIKLCYYISFSFAELPRLHFRVMPGLTDVPVHSPDPGRQERALDRQLRNAACRERVLLTR